ncbi:MAG: sulfatase-like hydrolase/transferase, partial [Candidatus Aminicenantes bacterium]|nr:sulfatase-like hydrolase/transferase [Candidatus Aminicenantes bacterium]
ETAPNLAKLIADAVYYKEAYPNGCWTMPSHISLLTGTLPSRHGINKDWQSIQDRKYPQLNKSITCVAEILKSHKIRTSTFAALPGNLGFSRGFDYVNGADPLSTNRKFSMILHRLERHKDKNFFFFIHTWMVHAPYTNCYFLKEKKIDSLTRYRIDHFRLLGKELKYLSNDFRDYLVEKKIFNLKNCMTLYDSGICYVDSYIGKIIKKAKQLGIYDDLMLIVVSDHGEHFAEHFPGKFYDYHGKDFYEEFIKVPLIIKYPGSKRTAIKNYPVSLIDVVPTILDYYNLDIPDFVQGKSLLESPVKNNSRYLVSEAISVSDVESKMIRIGHLKYIVTMKQPDGSGRTNWQEISKRRLFDLKNDPQEKNNLYKDPKFTQLCINLEKMLQKIILDSVQNKFAPGQTQITTQTVEQLKALGYL